MYFRKFVLFSAAAVYFFCVGTAQAAEDEKLGISFDLTYKSLYTSYGMQCYGEQGGLFETITLDLWNTGFYTAIGHESATNSGYENSRRFNYGVGYKNSAFNDDIFKMNYDFSWTYKQYYGNARNVKNKATYIMAFSWPQLLKCGIIPKYAVYYETPAGSGYGNRDIAGWAHVFGFDYNFNLEALQNPLKFSVDTTYNDGLGGRAVDHDFSHVVFGLSTKFNLTENLTFVPGIYQQISMDKSVNKHKDVSYCHLSLKYKF